MLGQVREGLEGLLEGGHGLAERGAVPGSGAGLLAVGHGLVPHLAPQGMVRQAFDLLGRPVPGERLQGLDDAGVQHPPPLLQETAVGHLVRQGVLEGVLTLGEEPRFVEELGRLEMREATMQRRLGPLGDGLQQGQRHVGADDGGGLEQALLLGGQAIDARGQHRLYRGGHLQAVEGCAEAIGAWFPNQHPGLHQVRTLSSRKKGLPSVRAISSGVSGARLGSSPRRACNSSSALAGGNGSSRSCV